MTVREAGPADAAAIAHIHIDTWRDAYAGILPDRVLLGMSIDREKGGWNGALLRGEEVFVAENAGDRVVGFGSCGPNRLRRLESGGEIYMLYVAPGHQGAGHGRALLSHMLSALAGHGYKAAVVWVLRENPARFFYQAMGGARLAERTERLWGVEVPQIAYRWALPYDS